MAVASTEVSEDCTRSSFSNGVFVNPWPEWKFPKYSGLFRFLLTEKNRSGVPCKEELNGTLPIVKPDLDKLSVPPETGLRVVWIGHASVLVQFDNITVLTDPIFSQRAGITRYIGPKRYRDVPLSIDELPKIDAVVLSHNHYDHLDYHSVVKLNKRFGEQLWWYVPLGNKTWFTNTGCQNVVELNWWDESVFPNNPKIKFVCTPCQHWSKRTLTDTNKSLWSSWAVIGPKNSFYFAGDTGYCSAFKQIGKKYGPFSLAAIPIGAYEPRWFMCPQHVNPEEAVQIHVDIKAKNSIGIHWGTFQLTYEHYLEPRSKLGEEMEKKGLKTEFITTHHGEIKHIDDDA